MFPGQSRSSVRYAAADENNPAHNTSVPETALHLPRAMSRSGTARDTENESSAQPWNTDFGAAGLYLDGNGIRS